MSIVREAYRHKWMWVLTGILAGVGLAARQPGFRKSTTASRRNQARLE
jgi:hypothetical protein